MNILQIFFTDYHVMCFCIAYHRHYVVMMSGCKSDFQVFRLDPLIMFIPKLTIKFVH